MINLAGIMEGLKRPEFLSPGARIGLLSTARKISREEIDPAVAIIESWGFEVVLGDALFLEHHQFAGRDEDRASDLQKMMDDSSIDAILCARGGYGTVRLLDALDFTSFLDRPKWIAGYSDVTALHSHLNYVHGIQSIHSTMPISFSSNTEESLSSLKEALCGQLSHHHFSGEGEELEVSGLITGGNLSMLYSLSGCPEAMQSEGKLLLLEDLDEYLYHIDRMMMNLRRSGQLNGLKAIVLGGMTDMNDNTIPFGKDAISIAQEHAEALDIPVVMNFPSGHGKDNRAVYLGAKVNLSGSSGSYSLSFTDLRE